MSKEIRDEIEKILDKFIPTMVTCPLCERVFDLTEVDWEGLIKELAKEKGKRDNLENPIGFVDL